MANAHHELRHYNKEPQTSCKILAPMSFTNNDSDRKLIRSPLQVLGIGPSEVHQHLRDNFPVMDAAETWLASTY